MADEKFRLFREKSIESIESPESLTDYLRVTSPRVWVLLGAVMIILAGLLIWGIVGSINTHAVVAVSIDNNSSYCYIPEYAIEAALSECVVMVDGNTCSLLFDDMIAEVVSQETDVRIRLNGGFSYGDIVYKVGLNSDLASGSYTGTLKTESLKPISLLFN